MNMKLANILLFIVSLTLSAQTMAEPPGLILSVGASTSEDEGNTVDYEAIYIETLTEKIFRRWNATARGSVSVGDPIGFFSRR